MAHDTGIQQEFHSLTFECKLLTAFLAWLLLLPRQDVFSLGCTLAELFLDGRAVMDLGQLLGYKRREWDPASQVREVGGRCNMFVLSMDVSTPAHHEQAW